MFVLEVTHQLQGTRDTDYSFATEGELAYLPPLDCDFPTCGCSHGFVGLESRNATTTVAVSYRPGLTIEGLASQLAAALHAGGWITNLDPADELVSELAVEVVEVANFYAQFGVGSVIERNGGDIRLRSHSAAA